jgi:hypothetical protein
MNIAIALLLLLFLLLLVGCAIIGVIHSLTAKSPYDEPAFREPGLIFHGQNVEQQSPRSRFVWQSRSH